METNNTTSDKNGIDATHSSNLPTDLDSVDTTSAKLSTSLHHQSHISKYNAEMANVDTLNHDMHESLAALDESNDISFSATTPTTVVNTETMDSLKESMASHTSHSNPESLQHSSIISTTTIESVSNMAHYALSAALPKSPIQSDPVEPPTPLHSNPVNPSTLIQSKELKKSIKDPNVLIPSLSTSTFVPTPPIAPRPKATSPQRKASSELNPLSIKISDRQQLQLQKLKQIQHLQKLKCQHKPPMEFTIHVGTLTGQVISLNVFSHFTIGDIKYQLFEQIGIPVEHQQLVFCEHHFVKDEATLDECGIQNGSTLHLVLHMTGGPGLPTISKTVSSSEKDVVFLLCKQNEDIFMLEVDMKDGNNPKTVAKHVLRLAEGMAGAKIFQCLDSAEFFDISDLGDLDFDHDKQDNVGLSDGNEIDEDYSSYDSQKVDSFLSELKANRPYSSGSTSSTCTFTSFISSDSVDWEILSKQELHRMTIDSLNSSKSHKEDQQLTLPKPSSIATSRCMSSISSARSLSYESVSDNDIYESNHTTVSSMSTLEHLLYHANVIFSSQSQDHPPRLIVRTPRAASSKKQGKSAKKLSTASARPATAISIMRLPAGALPMFIIPKTRPASAEQQIQLLHQQIQFQFQKSLQSSDHSNDANQKPSHLFSIGNLIHNRDIDQSADFDAQNSIQLETNVTQTIETALETEKESLYTISQKRENSSSNSTLSSINDMLLSSSYSSACSSLLEKQAQNSHTGFHSHQYRSKYQPIPSKNSKGATIKKKLNASFGFQESRVLQSNKSPLGLNAALHHKTKTCLSRENSYCSDADWTSKNNRRHQALPYPSQSYNRLSSGVKLPPMDNPTLFDSSSDMSEFQTKLSQTMVSDEHGVTQAIKHTILNEIPNQDTALSRHYTPRSPIHFLTQDKLRASISRHSLRSSKTSIKPVSFVDMTSSTGSAIHRGKKKCFTCNKKLGAASSIKCRCGAVFCAVHRYSDRHNCSFNYKEAGKASLIRDNPIVKKDKLVWL
ncbi:hypothetical protein RTP6_007088 [Batrachochytrium dendrobatidis]